MDPRSAYRDHKIPESVTLGPFRLRVLGVADLEEDYAAVMESADRIKGASDGWPVGLTLEENLIDLAWHQKEFELQRSFAWIVTDAESGAYLGCAYVYPMFADPRRVTAHYWFRTRYIDQGGEEAPFAALFKDWLAGPDWPDLTVSWPGREETA